MKQVHKPFQPSACLVAHSVGISSSKTQPLTTRDPRQESREMTCSSQASASKASPKVCKIEYSGENPTSLLVNKPLRVACTSGDVWQKRPVSCWDGQESAAGLMFHKRRAP